MDVPPNVVGVKNQEPTKKKEKEGKILRQIWCHWFMVGGREREERGEKHFMNIWVPSEAAELALCFLRNWEVCMFRRGFQLQADRGGEERKLVAEQWFFPLLTVRHPSSNKSKVKYVAAEG